MKLIQTFLEGHDKLAEQNTKLNIVWVVRPKPPHILEDVREAVSYGGHTLVLPLRIKNSAMFKM